jgi:DNA-binding CsgD family transcriptional regulator
MTGSAAEGTGIEDGFAEAVTGRELLERDEELAWLHLAASRLADGGAGKTILIEGPAGIGKSRLLLAVTTWAEASGLRVLRASGTELEHQLAFGGVRQLLGVTLEGLDTRERRLVLRGAAGAALRVLRPDSVDPGDVADPLYAITALVMNLAEQRPILISVDDVQWLDEASAQFLAYLARRVAGQPVLVVGAHRPDSVAPREAISVLTRSAELLRPKPLSAVGVERLLAHELEACTPDLVAACLRVTGGTPFLVTEVARALREHDRAARVEAMDKIAPTAIGKAVLDRIRHLPDGAGAVAEAVALFPAGTTLADAAAVAGIDPGAAAAAADALVDAAVLARDAHLSFLHPVMRAAVHEQLGPFGRRIGHARAAAVLLARNADVEEVAAHLLAGEPAGSEANVDVLLAAADVAERTGASAAAVRYLERALAEPPAASRRGPTLLRLGRLQLAAALPEAVATLRRAIDEADSLTARIDASIDLASACLADARPDDAVEALLAVRGDPLLTTDRERRLTVDAVLASAAWESTRYHALYASVIDAVPASLTGATLGERLAMMQRATRMFDGCERHDGVVELLRRAVGKDPEGPITTVEADALHLLISCGALDDADALARRWQERARAAGPDDLYAFSQLSLVRIHWFRGELREAEAVARLALELPDARSGHRIALKSWLAMIALAEGAYDDARRWLDEVESSSGSFGIDVILLACRGRIARAEGRSDDAVALLEQAYAGVARRASTNPAESPWLMDYGEALSVVGRRDDAVRLLRGLLHDAERFGEPRPIGLIHLALGRSMPGQARRTHLERAVSVLSRSPYRYDEARARLALGATLRRANRRVDARLHLRHALDYAQRQRLRSMASEAQEELRASGARIRRLALTGPEALTPSEQRIARLAADGMTNREIASHLFLTVKTIEMHLSNAFGKLGVASRRELPANLRD